MRLELGTHQGVGRFLTLTYADAPDTLDLRDLQLFLKRHREHEGPFRFFAVGEYGDQTGRGHWHLIVFGQPQANKGFAKLAAWKHGHVYEGSASVESIGYVAGYTLKLKTAIDKPTLHSMSRRPGIGAHQLLALGAAYYHASFGSDGKKSHQLPHRFTLAGRSYPLLDGGADAFRKGYELAGGAPKAAHTWGDRELQFETQRVQRVWDNMGNGMRDFMHALPADEAPKVRGSL